MLNRVTILVWGVLLAALPAGAQEQASELHIPAKVVTPNLAPWIAVLVACVLLVIIAAGAFKGSKRTHQD